MIVDRMHVNVSVKERTSQLSGYYNHNFLFLRHFMQHYAGNIHNNGEVMKIFCKVQNHIVALHRQSRDGIAQFIVN